MPHLLPMETQAMLEYFRKSLEVKSTLIIHIYRHVNIQQKQQDCIIHLLIHYLLINYLSNGLVSGMFVCIVHNSDIVIKGVLLIPVTKLM